MPHFKLFYHYGEFHFKTRNDLKLLDQQCAESLLIEICRQKEKKSHCWHYL